MTKRSIQLYSLREEAKQDFESVLRFCAEQGFEGVEFAGFHGHSKETIKKWLDQYGLTVTSAHVPLKEMQEDLSAVMEYHRYIGNNRIVVPYYDAIDEASAHELAEILKPISRTLKENGFSFYYHNHNHELNPAKDGCVLDQLLSEVGTDYLKLQVDTFWVYAAGVDPCKFLEDHKDNMDDIVHIKDGFDAKTGTEEQKKVINAEAKERIEVKHITMTPCALGLGTAPVAAVVKKSMELNIEWLVLENDFPYPTGYEDVAHSVKVLNECIQQNR
jgi:sugar phosphate isomerase/epimerase